MQYQPKANMPYWLLQSNMDGNIKCLYLIMICCSGGQGVCHVSQEFLADKIGSSIRTVRRLLKTMVQMQLINIERTGKKSAYKFLAPKEEYHMKKQVASIGDNLSSIKSNVQNTADNLSPISPSFQDEELLIGDKMSPMIIGKALAGKNLSKIGEIAAPRRNAPTSIADNLTAIKSNMQKIADNLSPMIIEKASIGDNLSKIGDILTPIINNLKIKTIPPYSPPSLPQSSVCESSPPGMVGEGVFLTSTKKSSSPGKCLLELRKDFNRILEVYPRTDDAAKAFSLFCRLRRNRKLPATEALLKLIQHEIATNPKWNRGYAPFLNTWLSEDWRQVAAFLESQEALQKAEEAAKPVVSEEAPRHSTSMTITPSKLEMELPQLPAESLEAFKEIFALPWRQPFAKEICLAMWKALFKQGVVPGAESARKALEEFPSMWKWLWFLNQQSKAALAV